MSGHIPVEFFGINWKLTNEDTTTATLDDQSEETILEIIKLFSQ